MGFVTIGYFNSFISTIKSRYESTIESELFKGETPDFLDLNPKKSEKVQINPKEKTQRNVILLKFIFNNFNAGVNPLWPRCVCMNIALIIKTQSSAKD